MHSQALHVHTWTRGGRYGSAALVSAAVSREPRAWGQGGHTAAPHAGKPTRVPAKMWGKAEIKEL